MRFWRSIAFPVPAIQRSPEHRSKLKTVWMIIPTFAPVLGGAQLQAQTLSKALLARGCAARVMTRRHSRVYPRALPGADVVDGIPVIRLYSRGGSRIGSILYILGGLLQLFRQGRGGIYHAHDVGAPGWLAVLARYLLGGRSIIKLRSGCHSYRRRFSNWFGRWQLSTLLRLTDRVLVVNSEVQAMVRNMGVAPIRVVRIPNGVDTDFFYPAPAQCKAAVREQLGLPVDKTICP